MHTLMRDADSVRRLLVLVPIATDATNGDDDVVMPGAVQKAHRYALTRKTG